MSAFERTLKLYLMSYSVSSSGEIEAVYSFTFVSFHLRLEIKLRYWLGLRIALPSSSGISGLTGVARIFVWGVLWIYTIEFVYQGHKSQSVFIGYITERGYKQAEAMLLQAKAEADFLHRIMIIFLDRVWS